MKHPGSTIYIPLSADLEIEVTFRAREFNGISSDPRVITRDCSLSEAIDTNKLLANADDVSTITTLDYPDDEHGHPVAVAIATELLTPFRGIECERLVMVKKQSDGSERDCGGRIKQSIIEVIESHLP